MHGAATKGIAELLIAKGADVDGWSWEKAQRIRCVNNLKQIGIATRIYATDNQDRFPWQVPQTEGGTAEIAQPQSDTDVSAGQRRRTNLRCQRMASFSGFVECTV